VLKGERLLGTHLSLTFIIESGDSTVSNKKGPRKVHKPTKQRERLHILKERATACTGGARGGGRPEEQESNYPTSNGLSHEDHYTKDSALEQPAKPTTRENARTLLSFTLVEVYPLKGG